MNAESPIRKKKRDFFRWYLMIPTLAFLLYFAIIPTIFLYWVSFTRYEIIMADLPVKFVGLKNFINVLKSMEFWSAAKVTVWLSIVTPFLQLVIGLVLALLLNRITKGRKIFTTIFLIPMMVAPAAAAFNFRTMYDPNYGPLNYFLSFLGISKIFWTGTATWALPSIIMVEVWQWVPFMMILTLAGLTALPQSVFEMASIASKSQWKTFIYITLPLLRPILILAFLLRFIDSFKAMDSIWVLTGGGPGSATENLAFLTFRSGLRSFNIGYSAAMSIIQLIIILLIANILLKKIVRKPAQVAVPEPSET